MLTQSHFVTPVPLVIARQEGILDARGVVLETHETRGSEEQFQQLLSGDADLAVTAIDNLFVWNQRGADAVIIGRMEQTTPLYVFAHAGISDIDGLEQATFGVDAASNGFALAARHVLARAGVGVRFVEVGGVRERWESLRSGQIDATLLGPPFDAFAEADALVRIAAIGELVPGYPGQALVASRRALAKKGDEVRAYMAALAEATAIANSTDARSGTELLERVGLPPAAASALWDAKPETVGVDIAGVQLVAGVRRGLYEMPDGAPQPGEIIDASFADATP